MDHLTIGCHPRWTFECRATVTDGVTELEFDLVRRRLFVHERPA